MAVELARRFFSYSSLCIRALDRDGLLHCLAYPLYMLLPFLCAFPFSDTVSWDFNTGYVMQIFVRRKKSTYLFAKALTIFIASAFLTATILFFDFAGTALYLPLVRPEALTNLYGISNRSLMAHLFYHKPLQYTVIYIIMDALLVGAWEIIALAVSVATRNPLQPALFPFLLYLLLYLSATGFRWIRSRCLQFCCPSSLRSM